MKKKAWMVEIERAFSKIAPIALLISSWILFIWFIVSEFSPFHWGKFLFITLFVVLATVASIRTLWKKENAHDVKRILREERSEYMHWHI